MNIYRHGDLLIRQIDKPNINLIKQKDNVVAYGEFTGHHHVVITEDEQIAVFTDSSGKKYIDCVSGSTITHPEHKEIILEPAFYEVIVEREFDPFESKIREVKD